MGTRLCPHSITPVDELRQMVEAGCPLIKLVDDFGPAAEFQPLYPDLVVIGRITEGAEYDPVTLYRQGWSYQAAAQAQVDRQTQKYQLNPAVRIWEGPNEPAFGDGNDPANQAAIAWYGHYEAYRLGLLAAMGLRGVVGNFSTGSPDLPAADPMVMWRNFLPALRAARQYSGFLGLHEYCSPWLWYWYGKYQLANCPNFQGPISEGDTGWLTFRYRKVYRDLLQGQGLGGLPLVITEFGLDRVGQGCPGTDMPAGAWKDLADWWRGRWDGAPDPIDYWRGPERDPERYYAEQLIWADRELRRDSFVAGACIFTFGHAGNPIWERFEISGSRIAGILTDYIRGLPLFDDVPDSHWAYACIHSLTTNGITGGCGWNRSYLLVHIGGPLMDAPPSVPLPGVVSPGQEVDIAVDFVSPAVPGTYRSQWQIQRPDGARFGTRPYVEIVVAT